MKILTHASAKRRQKGLRVSNFPLLMVVFKWHHGSEGVNLQWHARLLLPLVDSFISPSLTALSPPCWQLYLQRRFTWQGMTLLRPFLQAVFLLMSLYTCLSRISDYKHHWSDVLAGGLLGAVVALLVVSCVDLLLSLLPHLLAWPHINDTLC